MMSFVVTWIVLEIMILSEVNKTQKFIWHSFDIHMTSFICGILKKWYKWTYLQSGNRHINIEHKIYGYERGGINHKFGVNRYTLLYIYNIDKQQGPTVQCRELYSISYNNLQWKTIWEKKHTESLCDNTWNFVNQLFVI